MAWNVPLWARGMLRNQPAVIAAVEGGLRQRRIVVVGDLMLDRHIWGDVSRISPEAPVPVVRWRRQSEVPGGAANVAANLAGLGARVFLTGVVGRDADGDRLAVLLGREGEGAGPIELAFLGVAGRPTTAKVRIIAGHQQVVRLDIEEATPVPADVRRACLEQVASAIAAGAHAVVLSDYAKGLLDGALCQAVIAAGREAGLPVLVDPKGRDWERYRGASILKPNRAELADAAGLRGEDLDALLGAAAEMRRALGLGCVVLTLGAQGTALVDGNGRTLIPAEARDVFDVTGAGDTMIATLAAGIAAGLEIPDAVALANRAAGLVVAKVGTAAVTAEELLADLRATPGADSYEKILSREELVGRVARWRQRRERVVFTNGCFDLLHAGHVSYLEFARRHGDRLVVGLNTDRSVRALKGPPRPLTPEGDRARVLAGLAAVDAVTLFDDDTPIDLVRAVRPDVLVKGADYRVEQVVGASEVEGWGGRVVLAPLVGGVSTTGLIGRARGG